MSPITPNSPVWKPDLRSPIYVGGQYLLLDQIGEGATSVIFKARDNASGAVVALKVLKQRAAAHSRISEGFHREVQVGLRLRHPNVVEIYGDGVHDGWTYLVMEYIPGRSLASFLALTQVLTLPEIEALCRQFFAALAAVHELKIVHRDIKPNNLMLTPAGVWKLMDFGASRHTETPKTVGPSFGTADYLSPEQLMDMPTSPLSDIYSAGIVLYEALTGVPPFHAWTLIDRCTKAPPPIRDRRPDVPPWLDLLVQRCLQPNPDHRFPSAVSILQNLGSFEPVAAYVPPPAAPLPAAPSFVPIANLLTDTPGNPEDLTRLLVEVLKALTKLDENHDPVTPFTVRYSAEGRIEIAAHGATGRTDTLMVAMPKYAAPELLRGQPSGAAKADLYALGFIVYELLLGRSRFRQEFPGLDDSGSGLGWMEWHSEVARTAKPLSTVLGGIPAPLTDLIARMIEKDPAKRCASYKEALDTIQNLILRTQSTQQVPVVHIALPPAKKGRGFEVAMALLVTLGLAAIAYALLR